MTAPPFTIPAEHWLVFGTWRERGTWSKWAIINGEPATTFGDVCEAVMPWLRASDASDVGLRVIHVGPLGQRDATDAMLRDCALYSLDHKGAVPGFLMDYLPDEVLAEIQSRERVWEAAE